MLKKYLKNWVKKSLFSKILDIFFLVLLISLLFPKGRMAVGSTVNQFKAMVSQPKLMDEGVTLIPEAFEWTMVDVAGEEYNLNEAKGKVVFLNLWATWCPPCVGEMPGIQKLYDQYKDNSEVEFVLVSNEDANTIQAFIDRKKYTFPVYSSQIPTPGPFATRGIPTTYVISKNGEIVVKEIGAVNWSGKKMQGIIDGLLK